MLRGSKKFDIDEFVAGCLSAWVSDGAPAVQEVLRRTLAAGCGAVRDVFGEPTRAGLTVLYPGPELVVENMVWAPGMYYPAHNHNTSVITGVYAGTEVNNFYAKSGGGPDARLERTRTVDIQEGDTVLMAHDAIHRIENPDKQRFTGAFHIYMGDYLHSSRSIWYPGDAEEPATFDLTRDIFAAANRELEAARGSS